jgi:hypothetical protein
MDIWKARIIAIFPIFFLSTGLTAAEKRKHKDIQGEKRDSSDRENANGIFLSVDVGIPVDANSKSVRSGKKTFDQSDSAKAGSYMGAMRLGWKSRPQSLVIGYGLGALYGAVSSRGGAYAAGDVGLGLSALYALGFARVGYYFTKEFSASLQVENYLPFMERIVVSSPTGEVEETPEGSFEASTHSALLMVQYDLKPKLSVGVNIYIPALIYSSIQGRGFTGLTAGVGYDL